MRRKCSSCHLVGFETDVVCKRCGAEMVADPGPRAEVGHEIERRPATIPEIVVSYMLGFVGAVLVEFILLLPALALIGTHTRANSDAGRSMARLMYFLHLPTSVITWNEFNLVTILTQIVFWTFVLSQVFRYWLTPRTPKLS